MKNEITGIVKNSIAEELGIELGDALLEINGKEIADVFDYRYLVSDEYIEVLIEKKDGEQWLLEIEKDEQEDLGIDFSEPMMDKASACSNKCVFCFIDQLPKGMRDSLYFKDDDSRLSFLQGNYVTLTNMSDAQLDRIIYYHLSPINASVHTTNPALRVQMMKNKKAGRIMEQLKKISDAGIELNCQIVLVKGMNDGVELERSIDDLLSVSGIHSVSVVPVGITKHREGLAPLVPFDKADAAAVIAAIEAKQAQALPQRGHRFVYASDEFYIKAELPLPPCEAYDGFPQLENGVGMVTLLQQEFAQALAQRTADALPRDVAIVTGKSAYAYIKAFAEKLQEKFTKTQIEVIMVENQFFGAQITVSGLLVGADIARALAGQRQGRRVLLPTNCMRAEDDVFLDNLTLTELNEQLNIHAIRLENTGEALVREVLDAVCSAKNAEA